VQLTSAIDRADLAEERAALRRVAATLVARQPSHHEVLTAVTEAVETLRGDPVRLGREMDELLQWHGRDGAQRAGVDARARLGSDGIERMAR
jgi:hypothetical protein